MNLGYLYPPDINADNTSGSVTVTFVSIDAMAISKDRRMSSFDFSVEKIIVILSLAGSLAKSVMLGMGTPERSKMVSISASFLPTLACSCTNGFGAGIVVILSFVPGVVFRVRSP